VSHLWTADDDRLLRSLYEAGETMRAIASRLGRTPDAVDAHRRALGIPHRGRPMRPWAPAEDAFLVAATKAGVPASEIGRRLGRTSDAVRRRREICGITRPRHRPYTPDDDALLRAGLRAGLTWSELASRLGRTGGALRLRAQKLDLIDPAPRRRWTRAEDDLLRFGYRSGWSGAGIHARLLPERTASAICARARSLGLAVYGRRWSPDEDRRLGELVRRGMSTNLIAADLHRSREAVIRRCNEQGLDRPPLVAGRRRKNHRGWTAREDEQLRESPDVDTQTLARMLGRSESAVRRRRKAMLVAGTSRSQHHTDLVRAEHAKPAQVRQIAKAMPITPTRLIALSERLQLPYPAIRRVIRQVEANGRRTTAAR
jgi:DNA-binding CsgD family transcriptional regulator